VLYSLKLAEKRSDVLTRLSLTPNKLAEPNELNKLNTPNKLNQPNKPDKLNKPNKPSKPMMYALATVHRAENTDDSERLRSIFQALDEIARELMPVILPLHPRTRNALSSLPLTPYPTTPQLRLIDPVSYLDMLSLEKNARLILTDSGGVQKEAFILRVPCVTLREETEWVETVEAGWNVLVGADEKRIVEAARHFSSQRPSDLPLNPYGDGHASERIIEVVTCLRK